MPSINLGLSLLLLTTSNLFIVGKFYNGNGGNVPVINWSLSNTVYMRFQRILEMQIMYAALCNPGQLINEWFSGKSGLIHAASEEFTNSFVRVRRCYPVYCLTNIIFILNIHHHQI
jgi:hypothetical protein